MKEFMSLTLTKHQTGLFKELQRYQYKLLCKGDIEEININKFK